MEETINIVITDDKEQYRKIIKQLLKPYPVTVIGEAEHGKELLTLLRKKRPDIILLDLEMPVMDGNQTFTEVSKAYPGAKVIILSYYFETILLEDYIERGVRGYIPKDALEPALLFEALKQVHEGRIFKYEEFSEKREFTSRQKEILPLIFEGLTNEEIAGEVCISRRAVEKQRRKIYAKSGAEKVVDFYKYAFTKGLQFLGRR